MDVITVLLIFWLLAMLYYLIRYFILKTNRTRKIVHNEPPTISSVISDDDTKD